MKSLILIFTISTFLFGSPSDKYHLLMSKYYENSDTNKTLYHYLQIKDKPNSVKLNLGNIFYKMKNYNEAIVNYSQIIPPELEFEKLYNLGNCYAKLGKFDVALRLYNKANRLREDKDTKSNIKIIKKLREAKRDEEDKTNQKNRPSSLNGKSRDDNQNEPKVDNGKINEEKQAQNTNMKNSEKNERGNSTTKREDEKLLPTNNHKTEKNQIKNNKKLTQNNTDIEDEKWRNILNKREFNTLMVPLNKSGAKNDKTINPW